MDASTAPSRILLSHADHALFDLFGHTRSSKRAAVLAPIECRRDEAVVPAHEGIGGGNRGHLWETCATEWMGQRRKAAVFYVGQAQPSAAELGFEDAILFLEIGDDVLLVTVNPTGECGERQLENRVGPLLRLEEVTSSRAPVYTKPGCSLISRRPSFSILRDCVDTPCSSAAWVTDTPSSLIRLRDSVSYLALHMRWSVQAFGLRMRSSRPR